ncbi:vitamin B6 photo-protection and homoeostasis-domain-containing protein [Phyllosticta paracitricarpa]|uniref:Vitamin B6 photo-protection and homoeostasis-domain-containing protein n=1 Tax=Phyllosticta paracitricarpa TaxID=2016321 RepID=A0ABR1N088_9PEZI
MASYSSTKVEVVEYDDAGNVITTYVESGDNNRVDVILPEERKNIFQVILDVFLPAGYPQSVTEDYLPYQIYDSLQAFSSSIAGMLSSRAVLEGVGVGDADATPTKALLLSVVQSSAGRVATIIFAARLGTALEPECKSWRLAADFFNDTGMLLDMISPGVPAGVPRTTVLSLASILRALCGVAAGSSKASLSAHFAKEGNLGELNALHHHLVSILYPIIFSAFPQLSSPSPPPRLLKVLASTMTKANKLPRGSVIGLGRGQAARKSTCAGFRSDPSESMTSQAQAHGIGGDDLER